MKFITIGELLMRLSPPDYEKIRTTSSYVVNFGGAEANVAVSLANLALILQYLLSFLIMISDEAQSAP